MKEDTKLKRGQRSKLKKIKEKYKDQDEEDKRIRMEFLSVSLFQVSTLQCELNGLAILRPRQTGKKIAKSKKRRNWKNKQQCRKINRKHLFVPK